MAAAALTGTSPKHSTVTTRPTKSLVAPLTERVLPATSANEVQLLPRSSTTHQAASGHVELLKKQRSSGGEGPLPSEQKYPSTPPRRPLPK